jgi:outer membrane receptor protein involved in Fe transport
MYIRSVICRIAPDLCPALTQNTKTPRDRHRAAFALQEGDTTMQLTTSTRLLVLIALVALALPGVLLAQSLTQGAMSGTVSDPTGAIIPNATVKLTNLGKGYSTEAKSNAQGIYQFPLAEPGSYSIEVGAEGFRKYSAKAEINVGQATVVNVKLEVGEASGTVVEVTGATDILQTEAADMTTSFDKNLVENLPNGGNDLTAIAYTAPGVMMNSAGGNGNFNVNGLPATSNVFTVDGENQMDPFLNLNNSGPTNLMLGKNSIEEATVVTNAYGGQYGQQAGAQVNFVSKGGTNNIHGNLQYQWTGRSLDANDWFNTFYQPAEPRPFANNNQWAASLGGPIKKDKTFFFLDTEGIRYIVPATQTVYAPTPGFLSDTITNLGLVGASAATIKTYKDAQAIWTAAPHFAKGTPLAPGSPSSPGSCTDPLLGTQVDPGNTIGCLEQYEASPAVPAHEWLLIGRFDQNIGNKDRAFFRFNIDRGIQATVADPIDPAQFSSASFQPSYTGTLTWNHTLSGTATNQLVFAANYYGATFQENTNGPTSPFPYDLFVGFSEGNPGPVIGVGATGLNATSFDFPQGRDVAQYQVIDDFAKVLGRHSLKFGVNYRRYDISNYDASIGVTPLVYSDLSSFYGGTADFYLQSNPLHTEAPMNTGGFGLYGQDEWSVTSRLKLTFGLRAEHNFNPTCDNNCFSILNAPFSSIETQGASTPYNQALTIGRRDAFNSIDSVDWAPRFGFTWSPLVSSKTVISGGIGIFYDAFPALISDQFVSAPYRVLVTQESPLFGGPTPVVWGDPAGAQATTNNTANAIRNGVPSLGIPSLANGLTLAELTSSAVGGTPPSVTGFPGKLRTPQYQEWNFQVQQQLDSRSRVTLAYVGNHGIYEAYPNSTVNACSNYSVTGYAVCPSSGLAAEDSRFGTVTQWQSGAVSNYNGLIASYSRRMTAGFVINASYSWQHALDEISNGGLITYNNVSSLQGQINPACFACNNYGNADYDARHSLSANYVWTEPYHFGNPILNAILGGWLASENFVVRSGLPYTVTDGTVPLSFGGTATPAQALGTAQQSCSSGTSACFNSAEFASANALAYFPTQTRNQYRGPGFFDSDFTVNKNFKIRERMTLTVGANIYNVFNHPNFQSPNQVWSGSGCSAITPGPGAQPSCGQIVGQAAPPTGPYGSFFQGLPAGREGQFQAKIVF